MYIAQFAAASLYLIYMKERKTEQNLYTLCNFVSLLHFQQWFPLL